MSFFEIIFTILIKPLQIFFEYVYSTALKGIHDPGLSIIALSLAMNLLVLPLYNRADAVQEAENQMEQKLRNGVAHIRKTFKGDEKMMMLQTYYRQNGYRPTDVFKGSVSLLLEIPFFIAAYRFLSNLAILKGVPFGPIADLGAQDALITIGTFSINLLPVIMTSVNLVSCAIFTKGYPLKTKIQLYGMAVFFFFFLYKSPSGLVFYWTLNNIFSLVKTIYNKSQTAKKVLNIIFAITGVLILAGMTFVLKISASKSFLLIMLLLSVICFAPLVISVIKKKKAGSLESREKKERRSFIKPLNNRILFVVSGIYMSVFVGFLIPSNVIKSSPQEFVDIRNFVNPIWYIVSAVCIAFGLFVIWFGVFFSLASEKLKTYFNILMCAVCTVATVDYMFFGKNAVILTSNLAYTEDFTVPFKMIALNLLACAFTFALTVFLVNLLGKKVIVAFASGVIAFVGMSFYNCSFINNDINSLKQIVASLNDEKPSFTLSKKGKNVVVLMLDRAANEYIPYFINEKPELLEMYDGFTYYPNTISFGLTTNYGAPPIFGGYEYTPEEMNKRDTELLKDKNDEALKVMPVLFDENGYNVTVCDPPYAGYSYVPDLSIYDDYPDIRSFITKGYFWDRGEEGVSKRNFRNFFCYALMKAAPLVIQDHLYNFGMYNENVGSREATDEALIATGYTRHGLYVAEGFDEEQLQIYTALTNLDTMTEITDDDSNNFMMMDNEYPHCPYYLQEPNYELAPFVDNTEYEEAHQDRYTVNGITLEMTNDIHLGHYQCNMASLLWVGEWLDYLKENDVYDNTRIIIVADHGRWYHHNEMYYLDDGSDEDLDVESYYPLLMIKDFDSHGFTFDEQFMTNADVPTYAFKDIVDNPVNPFTGKAINNDEKYAHPQKILSCHVSDLSQNNGTTFVDGLWLSVEEDMRDKNNWKILEDNREEGER